MDLPTYISWMSPFPILGMLGGIFHSLSNFNRTFCKQIVVTLASDLGLHCLPMTHKKDAMLIRVKHLFTFRAY